MCDVRFVVVDGAQAFCHTPNVSHSSVDVCLAGAHKWLRAMHPLGMAFLPNHESQPFIRESCRRLLNAGDLDDPLLMFSEYLENEQLPAFTETVNTLPLFTAQAAADESLSAPLTLGDQFTTKLENADVVASLCCDTTWQPVRPADDLRSGILLLRSRDITRGGSQIGSEKQTRSVEKR